MDEEISILDKILLRSTYKKEIKEKSKRIQELEERLSDREKRIEELEADLSEAVTEKQSAYEERNQLSDKVTQLEDKIQSQENDEEEVLSIQDIQSKSIKGEENIREFVRILSSIEYSRGNAKTIGFESNDSKISEYERFNNELIRRISPVTVFEGSLGIIRMAVETPIEPRSSDDYGDSFDINRKLFGPSENLVFGVIRSDMFAVGLYNGWECTTVETVKSNVKGKHSKGGFSQSRFEESREKQIDEHVENCRDVLENVSDNASDTILVGSRQIISRFEDEVDYIATSDARGDPGSALEQAFRNFWSVTVYPNI